MEDVKMTAKSTTLILQCFRSAFCPDAVMYVGSRHECMQRQLTETEQTCGWSEQRRVFSREQEGPWRARVHCASWLQAFFPAVKACHGVYMCEQFQQVAHFMWNERCIHSQSESIRSCFTALACRGQSRRSLSLG